MSADDTAGRDAFLGHLTRILEDPAITTARRIGAIKRLMNEHKGLEHVDFYTTSWTINQCMDAYDEELTRFCVALLCPGADELPQDLNRLYNLSNAVALIVEKQNLGPTGHTGAFLNNVADYRLARRCFRALASQEPEGFGLRSVVSRAMVNFGNHLQRWFRRFDALEMFARAAELDDRNAMAFLNKGICLKDLWRRMPDRARNVRTRYVNFAYANLLKSLELGTLEEYGGPGAAHFAQQHIDEIDGFMTFTKVVMEHDDKCHMERIDGDVGEHITFAADHRLFLSHEVLCQSCAALNGDEYFPGFVDSIGERNVGSVFSDEAYYFVHLVNQVKEDFTTARYIAFWAMQRYDQIAASQPPASYASTLDYNEAGPAVGLLKTALSKAYSALDKVARLIFREFGVTQDKVYFRTLCDGTLLHCPEFLTSPDVIAIADIAKEFDQGCFDPKDGHPSRLAWLRNRIEHEFLCVHQFKPVELPQGTFRDYHVTLDRLREEVVATLQVSKKVILHLYGWLAMRMEQRANGAKTAEMTLPLIE